MIKSLSESQNLGFVRTLTTCDVVLEAVDAMDLLLPKLREDSLQRFEYTTCHSYEVSREQWFPTSKQIEHIWAHQRKIQNLSFPCFHTDEGWMEFLGKCASQAILLDSVTEFHLFGTDEMSLSLQSPLDHIDTARLRRLSIEGYFALKESHILNSLLSSGEFVGVTN